MKQLDVLTDVRNSLAAKVIAVIIAAIFVLSSFSVSALAFAASDEEMGGEATATAVEEQAESQDDSIVESNPVVETEETPAVEAPEVDPVEEVTPVEEPAEKVVEAVVEEAPVEVAEATVVKTTAARTSATLARTSAAPSDITTAGLTIGKLEGDEWWSTDEYINHPITMPCAGTGLAANHGAAIVVQLYDNNGNAVAGAQQTIYYFNPTIDRVISLAYDDGVIDQINVVPVSTEYLGHAVPVNVTSPANYENVTNVKTADYDAVEVTPNPQTSELNLTIPFKKDWNKQVRTVFVAVKAREIHELTIEKHYVYTSPLADYGTVSKSLGSVVCTDETAGDLGISDIVKKSGVPSTYTFKHAKVVDNTLKVQDKDGFDTFGEDPKNVAEVTALRYNDGWEYTTDYDTWTAINDGQTVVFFYGDNSELKGDGDRTDISVTINSIMFWPYSWDQWTGDYPLHFDPDHDWQDVLGITAHSVPTCAIYQIYDEDGNVCGDPITRYWYSAGSDKDNVITINEAGWTIKEVTIAPVSGRPYYGTCYTMKNIPKNYDAVEGMTNGSASAVKVAEKEDLEGVIDIPFKTEWKESTKVAFVAIRVTTTHEVTFDVNGGDESTQPKDQTVNHKDTANVPDEPIKPGYKFTGWIDKATDKPYDFNTPVDKDVKLVAQWEPVPDEPEVPVTTTPEDPTDPSDDPTDPVNPADPTDPTDPADPTEDPTPDTPATPNTPATTPAGPAATAATAAPAATAAIDDNANPMAEADEDSITDEENPLGAFDLPHCWVHILMIIGIICTVIYGLAVLVRRKKFTKDNNDFEKSVLGEVDGKEPAYIPVGSRQAI